MEKKILLVDMDDTICHYTKAYEKARKEHPTQPFPQSQYGFFAGLEPIEGALHFLDELTNYYEVWICTRCSSMNPMSYAEKAQWVKQHLGFAWVNALIITPDKGMIKGDILVDDSQWSLFGGDQILFHHETNNWFKIIKQLKEYATKGHPLDGENELRGEEHNLHTAV